MTDDLIDIPKHQNIKTVLCEKIPVEGIGLPEKERQYILFAYNRMTTCPYWAIKGHYTGMEEAKSRAKSLSKVWDYFRILVVDLP